MSQTIFFNFSQSWFPPSNHLEANNIKQISLKNNGELLIEYKNKSNQIIQIKSCLQQTPSKIITMDKLQEKEREIQAPKPNYALWIGV